MFIYPGEWMNSEVLQFIHIHKHIYLSHRKNKNEIDRNPSHSWHFIFLSLTTTMPMGIKFGLTRHQECHYSVQWPSKTMVLNISVTYIIFYGLIVICYITVWLPFQSPYCRISLIGVHFHFCSTYKFRLRRR